MNENKLLTCHYGQEWWNKSYQMNYLGWSAQKIPPNFSGMWESKIQNFSIFNLCIFQGNENYESTACHQHTPLQSMYSVTSGKSSLVLEHLGLKR
jgi:hypothetical protein